LSTGALSHPGEPTVSHPDCNARHHAHQRQCYIVKQAEFSYTNPSRKYTNSSGSSIFLYCPVNNRLFLLECCKSSMLIYDFCLLFYYLLALFEYYIITFLISFQVVEAGSDESLSANEDSPKRVRHDALTRRPSYRKILNDIAGCLIYPRVVCFQTY